MEISLHKNIQIQTYLNQWLWYKQNEESYSYKTWIPECSLETTYFFLFCQNDEVWITKIIMGIKCRFFEVTFYV